MLHLKIFDRISQLHDLHIEGFACFLFILSLHIHLIIAVCVVYVWRLRKKMRIPLFIVLILIITTLFLWVTKREVPESIADKVTVTDVYSYDTFDRITVLNGGMRFHVFTKKDQYSIGDELFIEGLIQQSKTERIHFGFDAYHTNLSQKIYGTIHDPSIKFIAKGISWHFLHNMIEKRIGEMDSSRYVKSFLFGQKRTSSKRT